MNENPIRRILILVLLLLLVIGVALKVLKGPRTESQEEEGRYDYIAAKVEELGKDPKALIAFVENEIRIERYQDSLCGPVGTLLGGAGSEVDRAALLVAMLREAGSRARFSRGGGSWVQIEEVGKWRSVLASQETGEPEWTGEELPAAQLHRLTVSLRRSGKSGVDQAALELTVAQLAPHPLVLRFEGRQAILELEGSDGRVEVPVDRDDDETLSLILAHYEPDTREPTITTREIYTRRYADYPAADDARNRHVIMVAPWTMSRWAYEKELELIENGQRKFLDDDTRNAYRLVLAYLRRSDVATAAIAGGLGAMCSFDSPRVIITSVSYPQGSESPASLAIDLRLNSPLIGGIEGAPAAVGLARSTYEAALEAELISQVSGRPALSALPILQEVLDPLRASTPDRLRTYLSSLERLRREGGPGARLSFLVEDDGVTFVHEAGGSLKLDSLSKELEGAMAGWEGEWAVLETGRLIEPRELATAALELELLLGPVRGSATDYQPRIGLAGSRIETAIPGRVTSLGSGLGVPEARIEVVETRTAATSWADGRFYLPLMKQPFAEFTVVVSADGYEHKSVKIDFAVPDAFPIQLTLSPLPSRDRFIWLTVEDLESELPKLKLSERIKDTIRSALKEREKLVAFVPREPVAFGGSYAHAWLLFDPATYQFTGVTEDGLQGSSMAGGLARDWVDQGLRGLGDVGPYDLQSSGLKAYAGFIASWYAYSAGKLEVLGQLMSGTEIDDLGQASAQKVALDFLKGMQALKSGLGGFAGEKVGYKSAEFEKGFMAGLKFFESNPVVQGK